MQIDNRRFFVVHSWMITKLKLKSLERDIFAIIYGFSQNPDARCYDSLNYLAGLTGYSKRSVVTALDSLLSKSFIFKQQESVAGITRNRYYHNEELVQKILSGEITVSDTFSEEFSGEVASPASENISPVSGEATSPASEVASPINNIKENISENKNIVTPVEPAPPKKHSNIYNRVETPLTDELASGKVIDEQKKERKKATIEERCIKEIDNKSYTDELKEELRQYVLWNYHSSSPKKISSVSDLKQKLNRLDQLIKQGEDGVKVVKQSYDNQWYGFFEYKEAEQKKGKLPDDGLIIDYTTAEEKEAELARRIAKNGVF